MSKRSLISVLLLLLTNVVAQTERRAGVADEPINGDYVGFQGDPSLSPDEPQVKWFHENTLVVRNNEAILDSNPFTVEHGKKTYSASDGGFTTYRGRFFHKGGQTFVYFRLFQSDYIAFPIGGCEPYSKIKLLPVTFLPNGFEIEGVLYKRKKLAGDAREHILAMLNTEPMEYTGDHPYNKDRHAPVCISPAGAAEPSHESKQK